MGTIKFGFPKGSLEQASLDLLQRAGYRVHRQERSYNLSVDDPEIEVLLIRAQEIPLYVSQGLLDAGLAGHDWVVERQSQVVRVKDLSYSKTGLGRVKWVLAVPQESSIESVQDLKGKTIATELVRVTQEYLKRANVSADVEFSWGATEVKPPYLVDAIVELTETGRSLRAHNLRIVDVVMESSTWLIANPATWENAWSREKISRFAVLLEGAIAGLGKVGLKMNVPQEQLRAVLDVLPALKEPTVSHLSREGWCAVETVLDEREARELIPRIKEAGGEGIVEYPLNKVIP